MYWGSDGGPVAGAARNELRQSVFNFMAELEGQVPLGPLLNTLKGGFISPCDTHDKTKEQRNTTMVSIFISVSVANTNLTTSELFLIKHFRIIINSVCIV